jgi:hypothetical protein
MKEFWENDSIIWSEGIKQIDLVIKDDSGGRGHAHKRKDSEKFFPTKMRITVVQVSAGLTYDPSLVPNLPRPTGGGGARRTPSAPGSGGKAIKTADGCAACDESVY